MKRDILPIRKKYDKNNLKTPLYVFYGKEMKIYPAYVSKHYPKHEKEVILLMIPNRETWRYIAVEKKINSIKKMSKHLGDFYYFNCLHSFGTKSKLEPHRKVCEHKDFCRVEMLYKSTSILEFNQYQKSDKTPFIIFSDFESLIEKVCGCKYNPENSSTTKKGEHIVSFF